MLVSGALSTERIRDTPSTFMIDYVKSKLEGGGFPFDDFTAKPPNYKMIGSKKS